MPRPTPILSSISLLLLPFLPSCQGGDSGPPLVIQRDSAGIEIVEAMRPLWADSSLWSIDPEPLIDLALSGSGPSHEFFRIRGLKQRPDGSLLLASRTSQEILRYSPEGEFLGALGRPGGRSWGVQQPAAGGTGGRHGLRARLRRPGRRSGSRHGAGPDLHVAPPGFRHPFPGDGTLLAESRVWTGLEEIANQLIRPPTALVRFDLEGVLIDGIGVRAGHESYQFAFEDNFGDAAALFARSGQVATLGPRVFYGSSDLMQVEELDPAGNITRILRIPGYGLDLTDAQVAAERMPISTSIFLRA